MSVLLHYDISDWQEMVVCCQYQSHAAVKDILLTNLFLFEYASTSHVTSMEDNQVNAGHCVVGL